jgi:hypothetical protein
MTFRRIWLIFALVLFISLFLAFFAGMFLHGDPVE